MVEVTVWAFLQFGQTRFKTCVAPKIEAIK